MSEPEETREEMIERYMRDFGLIREEAREAVAIALGEIPGDVIEVPDDERCAKNGVRVTYPVPKS
jgi:hypothetical protein